MPISDIAKNTIVRLPGIKQFVHWKSVLGKQIGHFTGHYKTRNEAFAAAPAEQRSTWNDAALVEDGILQYSQVHVFDWPVLFYIQKLVYEKGLRVVTDFGGHIGVKFYAYRAAVKFPPGMTWQVIDVPLVIDEGRRRKQDGDDCLQFFERLEDAEPCDLLLCSGSLQYSDRTLEELLDSMPKKPRIIVLSKVPVSRTSGYFTLERFIKVLPYRIFGPDELEKIRARFGYSLASAWSIPDRDILVVHSKKIEHVEMMGEAWALDPALQPTTR